jgi:hypothetical protein
MQWRRASHERTPLEVKKIQHCPPHRSYLVPARKDGFRSNYEYKRPDPSCSKCKGIGEVDAALAAGLDDKVDPDRAPRVRACSHGGVLILLHCHRDPAHGSSSIRDRGSSGDRRFHPGSTRARSPPGPDQRGEPPRRQSPQTCQQEEGSVTLVAFGSASDPASWSPTGEISRPQRGNPAGGEGTSRIWIHSRPSQMSRRRRSPKQGTSGASSPCTPTT